jgi:DNA-binding MarR family transcriptional regulator
MRPRMYRADMRTTERDDLAEALVAVGRTLTGISLRAMAAGPADVTLAQHRVLVLLATRGALSVNDVAAGLGVDQSNASRHCSRLARLGLLVRERARHDARTADLRLTAAGRRQVSEVRAARLREVRSVLSRMEVDDVHVVVKALHAFDRAATL